MATSDLMGVTAALVQRFVNPRFDPQGVNVAAYGTAALTAVAGQLASDSTKAWPPSGLRDLWAENTTRSQTRQITENTATGLTLAGDITTWAVGDAVTIRANPLIWGGTGEIDDIVKGRSAVLQSMMPEKYRQMLTRIEGEIIVERASAGQTTATLTFAPLAATAANLLVWRNPNKWPWPDDGLLTMGESADYHVVLNTGSPTNQIAIHLGGSAGLTEGDILIASYRHDLLTGPTTPAVPKVLREHLIVLVAHHALETARLAATSSLPEGLVALMERTRDDIRGMTDDERLWGIPEFDEIRLAGPETRVPVSPKGSMYGSRSLRRG